MYQGFNVLFLGTLVNLRAQGKRERRQPDIAAPYRVTHPSSVQTRQGRDPHISIQARADKRPHYEAGHTTAPRRMARTDKSRLHRRASTQARFIPSI